MPFTGPPEERGAIRDLYDAYADAANRGDRADWIACFAPDAVWKTHYFECAGQENIGRQYDQIMAGVADTTFFTQIGSIEVAGDRAQARAFCSESLLYENGGTYELTGEYRDELVKHGGSWLFQRRTYLVKREKAPQ